MRFISLIQSWFGFINGKGFSFGVLPMSLKGAPVIAGKGQEHKGNKKRGITTLYHLTQLLVFPGLKMVSLLVFSRIGFQSVYML